LQHRSHNKRSSVPFAKNNGSLLRIIGIRRTGFFSRHDLSQSNANRRFPKRQPHQPDNQFSLPCRKGLTANRLWMPRLQGGQGNGRITLRRPVWIDQIGNNYRTT
ncbi:MAG: hypothetical protein ACK5Z0_06765, partial [Planctomycetota bacterium]